MKRLMALVLALMTACACVSPALAGTYTTLETGDEMLVGNCSSAPLYASYERGGGRVLTYVPAGEVVLYIAAMDLYTCVAYDNYLGYMSEDYLSKLPRYSSESFRFPTGKSLSSTNDSSSSWDTSHASGENAFTFRGRSADPNQKISTRSGPGLSYVNVSTYPQSITPVAYYQTFEKNSVYWAYIEFTYKNARYRLYTPTKRLTLHADLPAYKETTFSATITKELAVYYGPDYNYARSEFEAVPAGATVKGIFTENGWLMFDYTLSNGSLHRGWAPPEYWR